MRDDSRESGLWVVILFLSPLASLISSFLGLKFPLPATISYLEYTPPLSFLLPAARACALSLASCLLSIFSDFCIPCISRLPRVFHFDLQSRLPPLSTHALTSMAACIHGCL